VTKMTKKTNFQEAAGLRLVDWWQAARKAQLCETAGIR
jgi:hypothetical protein